MLTVQELLRGFNLYWTNVPGEHLSEGDHYLWHCASDLCDLVQMVIEPEDLPDTWEDIFTTLRLVESHLKEVRQLPPQSLALVLLLARRARAGVPPRAGLTPPGQDEGE